jgi:hypothetical protein
LLNLGQVRLACPFYLFLFFRGNARTGDAVSLLEDVTTTHIGDLILEDVMPSSQNK